MKLRSLLVVLALTTCVLTSPARADDPVAKMPPAMADKPWSVAGPWYFMHSLWAGPLTLAPDGSILGGGDRLQGRWLLTAQQDQVHLIIRWRDWASVDLAMVKPDEFYGKDGQSELRLRRQPPVLLSDDGQKTPAAPVEVHVWHQGEPPVKLIRRDEGFCALTSVTGFFRGGGESVKVYVAEDGYWYLGGTSQQDSVAAECIVVRFRHTAKLRTESPEEEIVTPLHK